MLTHPKVRLLSIRVKKINQPAQQFGHKAGRRVKTRQSSKHEHKNLVETQQEVGGARQAKVRRE